VPKDIRIISSGLCRLTRNGKTETVSGIQRLCQKFVIELLTKRGSMLFLPLRGCSFLSRVQQKAETEMDVIVAFASATQQVQRNLKEEETAITPPTERFKSATLNRITVDDGFITLEIDVRNRAGNTARVVTPPIPIYETE
jgi:hypothetical protein